MADGAGATPDGRAAVEAALCQHITVLAQPVRVRTDALWHGGAPWDRLTARLDDIDHLIRRPLREHHPPTPAHLAELANAVQWLLAQQAPDC
ncbi:DUF6415 family natural product biosynthesis protein [Streptomyces sp. Ac-502]|uniref:DUF6415 family natural product biosynthesis protein n=1 Tax=Streptomyces sp. Ac-502 TaxID=3342801 RepID=UPI0038629CAA